jgi:hypothetical protein
MTMGTSSWSEHSYLPFWLFDFPSWLIFLIRDESIWFGLVGFLLVRKGFSKVARFAYSANMFLKIKTVCVLDVIPEMLSFSMRPPKYFYDKPLPKYLEPKTVPNLLSAPCTALLIQFTPSCSPKKTVGPTAAEVKIPYTAITSYVRVGTTASPCHGMGGEPPAPLQA